MTRPAAGLRGSGQCALLLVALSLSVPALAQQAPVGRPSARARAHVQRAEEAYAAGDYRRASAELEVAHGLEPQRDLLFAWAQAERLGGNCRRAAELYRRFLAAGPPRDEAARAQRQLERCEALQPAQPASAPSADRPAAASAPALVVLRRPWYRDWWGHGLAAAALAGLASGGGLLWAASGPEQDARGAERYSRYQELVDEADRRRLAGGLLLGAGGALAVAALIHYLVHARPRRAPAARLGLGACGALLAIEL